MVYGLWTALDLAGAGVIGVRFASGAANLLLLGNFSLLKSI